MFGYRYYVMNSAQNWPKTAYVLVPLQSRQLSNDDGSENFAKKLNLGRFKLWRVY